MILVFLIQKKKSFLKTSSYQTQLKESDLFWVGIFILLLDICDY